MAPCKRPRVVLRSRWLRPIKTICNTVQGSLLPVISAVNICTLFDIYAAPFLRSVMAGVTSIMCSYNLINGTYACDNNNTINGILKNELGFQGFVMSDWSAQHSMISAITGLDMSMPGDITFVANLTAYIENGTIPEACLDDMATRILASWYLLGQDSPNYPKTNFNAIFPLDEATNEHIDVQDDHGKLVRECGRAPFAMLISGSDSRFRSTFLSICRRRIPTPPERRRVVEQGKQSPIPKYRQMNPSTVTRHYSFRLRQR